MGEVDEVFGVFTIGILAEGELDSQPSSAESPLRLFARHQADTIAVLVLRQHRTLLKKIGRSDHLRGFRVALS